MKSKARNINGGIGGGGVGGEGWEEKLEKQECVEI